MFFLICIILLLIAFCFFYQLVKQHKSFAALAIIAAFIAILTVTSYSNLGNPKLLNTASKHDVSELINDLKQSKTTGEIITKLSNHLYQFPTDNQRWFVLAKAYNSIEAYGKAAEILIPLQKSLPYNQDIANELAIIEGAE